MCLFKFFIALWVIFAFILFCGCNFIGQDRPSHDAVDKKFPENSLSSMGSESVKEVQVLESIFFLVKQWTTQSSNVSFSSTSPNLSSSMSYGPETFISWTLGRVFEVVSITELMQRIRDGIASRTVCITCQILALLFTSNSLSTYSALLSVRFVCIAFRIQKSHICNEMVDHVQYLFHYLRQNSRLTPDEMCGVSIGLSCATIVTSKLNWTIEITEPINQFVDEADSSEARTRKDRKRSGKPFYVGFITDIHMDPLYVPGANTDCSEPVCCRPYHGISQTIGTVAGIWGNYYSCDTPLITVQSTLEQLKNSPHKLNYIVSAGDIVPHDVWNYRRAKTLGLARLLDLAYRRNVQVPVYSIIGNHEAIPVNCFSPPFEEIKDSELAIDWLYTSLAQRWKSWLANDTFDEFKRSGNYVLKIRKGFRIISVNTNYCARLNAWILYDTVDLGSSLKFLVKSLQEAENVGDNVHIIGHIAPDHRECTQAWLYNFLRILERYQETIKAQFYGHNHRDEFRVYYSLKDPSRPIGFSLINPALTSYSQTNPAYRVYQFSPNGDIEDYFTYHFNLTENKFRQNIRWKLGYKASSFYSKKIFDAQAFDAIVQRLENDSQFFDQYFKVYYSFSDADIATSWDEAKKTAILQDIRVRTPLQVTPYAK